jgi:hypothetical protein
MGAERVVKWAAGMTEGEFLSAVVRAGGLEPGSVVELDYLHAGGCPKPEGGICRCSPDVVATITVGPVAA